MVSSKVRSRINELKEKANSWEETEVNVFDPKDALLDSDYNDMIDRLKKRVVLPNLEEPEKSPYGTPATYVNLVADHLTDSFDFSTVKEGLRMFDHFKTVIGDINLHFIHMKGSEEKDSVPVLLLHGWPSTVWEFRKSIPMLLEEGYTVVAPSLPGHGFTDPPKVTGVGPAVIACAYHKLMQKLGYERFVVHGGDWGSMIGCLITYIYPESVMGFHTTLNLIFSFGWRQLTQLIIGGMFPSLVYTTEQEKKAMHPISKVSEKQYRGMAYFHVQSVLPDSYGYGMVDSPVGLIGWIGSLYATASSSRDETKDAMANHMEGVENFGLDEICANLSIFWCMKSAQASMRIYYEFYWNDLDLMSSCYIPNVPVAISNFPNEITHVTEFVSRSVYGNIKQFTYNDRGGHFAHTDNTEGVVGDLISFIQKLQ